MSPSSPIGVFTWPTRHSAEERNVFGAEPEFVEPSGLELVVLKRENQTIFAILPKSAFDERPDATKVFAILQVTNAAPCDASSKIRRVARVACDRRCLQGRRLIKPDIVPLRPTADVHREIVVRRGDPQKEAVAEFGFRAEVAADNVTVVLRRRRRERRAWHRRSGPSSRLERSELELLLVVALRIAAGERSRLASAAFAAAADRPIVSGRQRRER